MGIAGGELLREAKRILPKMMPEQAMLLPTTKATYGLFVPKNKWRKAQLQVPDSIVRGLLQRELLLLIYERPAVPDTDCDRFYILSDVGRHWVRRLQQPDNAFLAQHQIEGRRFIRDSDKANAEYHVNLAESPLGWLRKRKGPNGKPLLSDVECDAGEKLRDDFTLAHMSPRVTANWSGMPIHSKGRRAAPDVLVMHEAVVAAKRRVEKALHAVGPGLSDALIETCCLLNGME